MHYLKEKKNQQVPKNTRAIGQPLLLGFNKMSKRFLMRTLKLCCTQLSFVDMLLS